MLGWRGTIGYISPAVWAHGEEYQRVLPEGIVMHVLTLGLANITPEEMSKVYAQYMTASKRLAQDECDVIVVAGTPIITYMGYEHSLDMLKEIQSVTGIPTTSEIDVAFDSLRFLNAKKLVIATPYEEARNKERKDLCNSVGFNVVNIKGLNLRRAGFEIERQPPYASYRLAKQAFMETPDCDAIWISCPGWATVRNIQKLENDTGKPVVSAVTTTVWASLKAMHVKEPIKGFGKLLELER